MPKQPRKTGASQPDSQSQVENLLQAMEELESEPQTLTERFKRWKLLAEMKHLMTPGEK